MTSLSMDDYMESIARAKQTYNGGIDVLKNYLKAHGVTDFSCNYSGYGDSGDTMEITINPKDVASTVPDTRLAFTCEWHSSQNNESKWVDVKDNQQSIREIIEDICWDMVSQNHGGWENNEGGQGTIWWDSKKNVLNLNHEQNHTETTATDLKW
jgi:hypothetical protein